MEFINKSLISHPINWVTVILMLLIASIAGHLILTHFTSGDTPPLSV